MLEQLRDENAAPHLFEGPCTGNASELHQTPVRYASSNASLRLF